MNFIRKSLNSLVKLQQMFRIAEIELGMENTIGITLESGVGVQSAVLHVCPLFYSLLCLHACKYTTVTHQRKLTVGLFLVGCFTSQQHASVSQGRIC